MHTEREAALVAVIDTDGAALFDRKKRAEIAMELRAAFKLCRVIQHHDGGCFGALRSCNPDPPGETARRKFFCHLTCTKARLKELGAER